MNKTQQKSHLTVFAVGIFCGLLIGLSVAFAVAGWLKNSWRSTLVEQGFYQYVADPKTGRTRFVPVEDTE